MITIDQSGLTNNAKQWKFATGCAIAFLVICSVPISVRMMLFPIIGVENTLVHGTPSPSEVQRHDLEIERHIEDKQRVASELLGGERVTYMQAADWHSPYISSDPRAPELSQRIANWQKAMQTSQLSSPRTDRTPLSQRD